MVVFAIALGWLSSGCTYMTKFPHRQVIREG